MKVKLDDGNGEIKTIYLDGYLKSNLDLGKKRLENDWDQCWFIDGEEGSGKSVLAITCAYYVSPTERRPSLIDRIVVRIEDAPEVIRNAKPFDSIVIDEAFGGMSSTGFMLKLNKMLQRLFTEIRAKNLYVFIVAPTFMDINKYFAIWRSKCLLHVYADKGSRGYCSFFTKKQKKALYILGKKKLYNYGVVRPAFRFRFTNAAKIIIDYNEYTRRKTEKNLEIVEPEYTPPKVMKECWIKVREALTKELSKPLTQIQYAELIEISDRSVRKYDKIIRERAETRKGEG